MNIRLNALMLLFLFPCMMNAIITDEIARNPQFKAKYPKECAQYTQAERALTQDPLYQQSKEAKQEVFSFELESKQIISYPRALTYYIKGRLTRESLDTRDFSLRTFKKNCKNSIAGYKESYNDSYLNCDTQECSLAREMMKEFNKQKETAEKKAKMLQANLEAGQKWKDFIEASREIDQAYSDDKELYGKI